MSIDDKQDITSIPYLKDAFKIDYEAYEGSRNEAKVVWDMYHNRNYTTEQLDVLQERGQPAETYNVIKMFTRMLLGYYSTVVNNIQATPVGIEDVQVTELLNDVISYTLRDNNFTAEGEMIKLSGIVSGLMCVYVDAVPTGEVDEFGRPNWKVRLEHVPESELVLDPNSTRDDYSDARRIHRFKWVSEQQLTELFGKAAMDRLEEYYNFTDQPDADYAATGRDWEVGYYKIHNQYLIVHSVVRENGQAWSIFWNDDVILKKTKLANANAFPYRVVKTNISEEVEYYGIFREVVETQKAMNQALIKLQLLVNTQKAFVQDGAVDDLAAFTTAFNRVTAVIPVRELAGIKIESLGREALEQYKVIENALDRIQRILGINDSFLGMAYASDSGRKVKLQQNASVVALRYFTGRVDTFYRHLGWDIANLITQYYHSHQILRIADDNAGERWIEVNKPMESFQGAMDQQGQPVMQTEFEEALDPRTGEPLIVDGSYVVAPIPEPGTELAISKYDIEVHTNAYNDEDEKNQMMIEQVLQGAVGQLLAQVNPSGFFRAASLSMDSMKTKNSPEIAAILQNTAQMLQQSQQAQQGASQMAQGMPGKLGQQGSTQIGQMHEN